MASRTEVVESNLIFTAGNLINAVLSFVFSIVIARLLQPQDFGILSFVLTVTGFFVVFTDLGTSNTVARFVAHFSGEAGKAKAVLMVMARYRAGLIVVVAAGLGLFNQQVAMVFQKPELAGFVLLAGVVLAFNSLLDFVNVTLLGLKQFRGLFAVKTVERLGRLAIAVGLVWIGWGATGAVAGVAVGYLFGIGVAGAFIRRQALLRVKREPVNRRQVFSFGMWSLLSSIVVMLYSVIDALLISALRPIEEVGFFSIAFNWVMMITYLVPISSLALFPYFSAAQTKEQGATLFGTSLRYTILLVVPLAFLVSAFSFPLIRIFYGAAFVPAALVLQVLSFVAVPLVIGALLSSYFNGIGKPKIPALVTAATFVVAITLNLLLIPLYGMVGAAYATVATRLGEMVILGTIAVVGYKAKTNGFFVAKTVVASLVVYFFAQLIPITSLLALIGAGIALIVLYGGIALGLRLLSVTEVKGMWRTVVAAMRFRGGANG